MPIEDVLGINRRNIEYIMALNKREHFALVDNKLITKQILSQNGIPSPELLESADSFFSIESFFETLNSHNRFVIKPACGSGGSGIVVVKESIDRTWYLMDGTKWNRGKQREHIENILYGTFSLDSSGDTVFAEKLIVTHPDLHLFAQSGLPDIRIILYRGNPVVSMMRVPTRKSHGKANLHAGGFAVSVDQVTGITGKGWYRGDYIERHPETGQSLCGIQVPFWKKLVHISTGLYRFFPLGYMGVDFAIDTGRGPLILELNARPGLEIQNVSGYGIRSLLEDCDS